MDPSYKRQTIFDAKHTPFGDLNDIHNEDGKSAIKNGLIEIVGDKAHMTGEGIKDRESRYNVSPGAQKAIDNVARVSAERFFGEHGFDSSEEKKGEGFELINNKNLKQNLENLFNNHGSDIDWDLVDEKGQFYLKIKPKGKRPYFINGTVQEIYDKVFELLNNK